MKRLVLVEDDPSIAETLRVTLSYRGFSTEVAEGVSSALHLLERATFDIAVVDVALADGNGFDFCRELRQRDAEIPILMLTARTDENSAVQGIDCGADDYVRKPCGLEELTARLNRLLGRRDRGGKPYSFQSLYVDPEQRIVSVAGELVPLRRREFEILLLLIKNSGEIVSREQVLRTIDEDLAVFDRAVDSHLCRLRSKLKKAKLEDARIVSIYGIGYRLEKA